MKIEVMDILKEVFICSLIGHNEINITPYLGYVFGHGFNYIECKRCHRERWA